MRALIKTFGCKVNFADSDDIAHTLAEKGWESSHAGEGSDDNGERQVDLVIVNSCVVTHTAVAKVRKYIRRTKREYPNIKVILAGCGIGNEQIRQELMLAGAEIIQDLRELPPASAIANEKHVSSRSRRFIKIQDGCDTFCAYCIVPYVRRRWNASADEIEAQARRYFADGIFEVVLCGVNIGLYSDPDTSINFTQLIRRLLERLPAGLRLRISSVEPEHISPELISLFKNQKLCPHLHIPLQSGSEKVLRDMGRRYSLEQYRQAAASFREQAPNGAVTTDLIVGFPTEEERHFRLTLEAVNEFGFERTHVFRYSQRPGTKASYLKPITQAVVAKREAILLQQCAAVADERWLRFLGAECEVVLEGSGIGYGEAYQRVQTDSGCSKQGTLCRVKLVNYCLGVFQGEALGNDDLNQ